MKKRFMAFVLCIVLGVAGILTACGNSAPAGSGAAAPAASGNDSYTLVVSTTRPEGSWYAKMYDDMFAEMEEASNGRLKFEVHHNNTLGAPSDLWAMFTNGGIDIMDCSPGMIGDFYVSNVFNVPFLFDNDAEVEDAMWSLYHEGLIPEYSDNMEVLMFLPNGGLEFMTTKKIQSMADLNGMKLRASSQMLGKGIEALGGTSVSIQPSEMTMSLQQGVLDGVITGLPFAALQSLQETCKYAMNCNIAMTCMFCGVSKNTWAKLPADLREILKTVSEKYYRTVWTETNYTDYVACLENLKTQGVDVYKPSPEFVEEMKAATANLTEEFKANITEKGADADRIMEIVNTAIARNRQFITEN